MPERTNKRAIFGWVMYDWANSAFATTIMAAVLPVYYSSVAAVALPRNQATARWAFTTSLAALLAAVLGPVLGAIADFKGARKTFLLVFMLFGATSTALLYFVRAGDWCMASVLFVLGNLGFAGSLVFYDALLPHVASPGEIDQVSARGYAVGYAGGGILLAINVAMILFGQKCAPGLDPTLMPRLAFLSVAVWWIVFTIPLMRGVPEPPRRVLEGERGSHAVRVGLRRLAQTLWEMRRYRDLFLFLIAFWVYANGIGTIIVMAAIYGREIGISQATLIGTLLMAQFVGMPFAVLFGALARKTGAKPAIGLGLVIYTLIAVAAYFMSREWHFWAIGAAVAMVQGGSQALSRSLMGRLIPKSKSAEFYGFFSVAQKFSSIAGPAIFGAMSVMIGHSRLSILSLVIFFLAGLYLLTRVNVERGIQTALKEEQELMAAS
jgi:MFS transporter, UMF1 family